LFPLRALIYYNASIHFKAGKEIFSRRKVAREIAKKDGTMHQYGG